MTMRVPRLRSAMRHALLAAAAVSMSGCSGSGGSTPPVIIPGNPTPTPSPTAPTPTPTPTAPVMPGCTVADSVRRSASLAIVPQSLVVRIVAIGSSSTSGYLASSPAVNYPSVLQSLLSAHPDIAAYVVYNKGVGGDTLVGTQARLQRDALDLHPQLIVLQVGANDAIAGQTDAALADFTTRLRAVVTQIRATTPVVLMNSQHYPNEPAKYVAYQNAIEQISAEQNVPIFDRYAMMKRWIDSGSYRYADVLASDLFHPNDFTYRCMAQVVAELTLAQTVTR